MHPIFVGSITAFVKNSRGHAGIIIAERQRYSVGEMLLHLLRRIAAVDAETMRNRSDSLIGWRVYEIPKASDARHPNPKSRAGRLG
jgi:hypothetical protein